jgi:TPR repeat protein
LKEFQSQRDESALLLSLYSSFQGYSIAHFNAAWLAMKFMKRRGGSSQSNGCKEYLTPSVQQYQQSAAFDALQSFAEEHENFSSSHLLLGEFYMQPGTSFHNYSLAADQFQQAANLGSFEGMHKYAWMLHRGLGRILDRNAAQRMILRAIYQVATKSFFSRGIRYVLSNIAKLSLELIYMK